ncbi:MAG: GxxExxY protein [bacterium]|nr:GxxExxY protein [bacterium]
MAPKGFGYGREGRMNNLILADEVFAIQGAIFDVYKTMGAGFLEAVYQECLEAELTARGIPFRSQADIEICYKGQRLKQMYRADFICYDDVIIELKAMKSLSLEHEAQVHNYLRATNKRVGLLVNFGHLPGVEIKRIVV